MFPGGIADKTGNRYEAKCAVLRLLEVISGRAHAIRFESLEREAHGFEFELHREDRVEWYQTKRQGPSSGNWTLRRLRREGILTNFRARLALSPENHCVFLSQESANEMRNLADKARLSDGLDQFDQQLPESLRPAFCELQTIWGLSAAETFWDLRRCWFFTFPEPDVDRQIEVLGGLVFAESAEFIFPVLRDYLERNFNRLITTDKVREDIAAQDLLRFRAAALDPTLRERVRKATERYLKSYTPFGFRGQTISRRETASVLDLLCRPQGPLAILLTGAAGSGKSGVVHEVIAKLGELGTPVLAFRVDRILDVATVADLGQRLIDQRGDPCVTLSRIFPSGPAVMVIDQVDAISDVSGRVASARELVFELVDSAKRLGNARVILVCRSFDLDNDKGLKTLAQANQVERLEVQMLDWEQEVKPVLLRAGVEVDRVTPKQRPLLTLPLNLSVFLEVTDEGESPNFASTTDLFDRLVERKDRVLREKGIQGFALVTALTAIARSMSDRQLLDASERVLDGFPGALAFLASEQLVIRQDRRVAFFHETFFDYVFSRDFVREGKRILPFLTADEQHLFRRTQVRQILAAYRQAGDQQRYLAELRDVFLGDRVRYHVKDAVARWLGTVETPTDAELEMVLALDSDDGPLPALVRLVLYGNPAWFPLLRDRNLLERWLTHGGERGVGALVLLANAAGDYPEDVIRVLRRWWNGDPERGVELVRWFSMLRGRKTTEGLLEFYLEIIRSGPRSLFEGSGLPDRHEFAGWVKDDPSAAGEVLKAWFETWFIVHPEGHPFQHDDKRHIELYWMAELAKVSPAAFLHGAVTAFIGTVERITVAEGRGKREWTWRSWHRTEHLYGSDGFLELMRVAFRTLAGQDPERARRLLAEINPQSHPAALYLHLEAIAGGAGALSDLLAPLMAFEGLFNAGPSGAPWLSFMQAARSALPHLSAAGQRAVEDLILDHWPEIAYAARCAREGQACDADGRRSIAAEVVRTLNGAGFVQWAILKGLGTALASPKARRRLQELERKFKGIDLPEPDNLQLIKVQSPIGRDQASHMTDDQWLEAIRTYKEDRWSPGRPWNGRGGARELAQVLQSLAKQQPARFARLISRLPEDGSEHYQKAILMGLAEAEPELDDLRYAVRVAHGVPGRPFGQEICRLIQRNPAVAEGDAAFNALCWYFEHGSADQSTEEEETLADQEDLDIERLVYAGNELYVRGTITVRGAAAEALGEVIWDCPLRLRQAMALLERRIEIESVASVRCCLMRSVYSVLRHDQRRAAELMRALVVRGGHPDLKPLMTHIGIMALYHVLHGVPEVGREILDLLLVAADRSARLIGAYHLFREALGDEGLAARADALVEVDPAYRLLAARVAADNLANAAVRSRADGQLRRFFDDSEKSVRREAARCFRGLKDEDLAPYRGLMSAFIRSRAFEEESLAFFILLSETAQDVRDEVVAASERLVEIVSHETGSTRYRHEVDYLDGLIIREYAGLSGRPDQRRKVLDIIDRMLELRLYGADKIVSAHERM